MIKITINLDDNVIKRVLISGHAGYEESGKDIVCAAVSSIAITTVNAIMRINKSIDYFQSDDLEIVVKDNDIVTNSLIENMVALFEELEQNYKGYVKIIREVS